MVNLNYPVHLKAAEEGGSAVTFPQIPEAITQGDDEAEALANAVDALETALSFYIDAGLDLPKAGKGKRTVRPSALGRIKLAIYHSMREQGVRKSELARRMGWNITRSPASSPRISCPNSSAALGSIARTSATAADRLESAARAADPLRIQLRRNRERARAPAEALELQPRDPVPPVASVRCRAAERRSMI